MTPASEASAAAPQLLRVGIERDSGQPAGVPSHLQARRRHAAVLLESPSARARVLARMAVDALETGERIIMFDGEGLLTAETMALIEAERPANVFRTHLLDLTDPQSPGIDLFGTLHDHDRPIFADLAQDHGELSMLGHELAAAVAKAFGLLNRRLADEGHARRMTLHDLEQFTRDEVIRADVMRAMPVLRLLQICEPEQRLVRQTSGADFYLACDGLGRFCRSLLESPIAHLFTGSSSSALLPELPAAGDMAIVRADVSSAEGHALMRALVLRCADQASSRLRRDPVTGEGGNEQAIIVGDDFSILDTSHLTSLLVDSTYARSTFLLGMSSVERDDLLAIAGNCQSLVLPRFPDKERHEGAVSALTDVQGHCPIDWSSLTSDQVAVRMATVGTAGHTDWGPPRCTVVQLPASALPGADAGAGGARTTYERLRPPASSGPAPSAAADAVAAPDAPMADILAQMPDLQPVVFNEEDGSYHLELPYVNSLHCDAGGPAMWEQATGRSSWYRYGQLHCENGPALLAPPNQVEWWVHGRRIDNDPAVRERIEQWGAAERAYDRSLLPMPKRARRMRV